MDTSGSTGQIRELLIAGLVLALGARYAVRTAMPARRGRHRRRRGSPRVRPGAPRREPVPVTGGATGLLESIPFLEPAAARGRFGETKRLLAAVALAASVIAAILFVLGRLVAAWLETIKI